jgi:hypothetical protein
LRFRRPRANACGREFGEGPAQQQRQGRQRQEQGQRPASHPVCNASSLRFNVRCASAKRSRSI